MTDYDKELREAWERWEEEPKTIRLDHPNGYSGLLLGKNTLIIYDKDKEILHTGFRNIHTKEELYDLLEQMPEFLNALKGMFQDEYISV